MQVLEDSETAGSAYRLLLDRLHEIVVDRVVTGVTVTLQRRTSEGRWVVVNGYSWTQSAVELHRGAVGEVYRLSSTAAGPVGFVTPVGSSDYGDVALVT